MDIDELLATVPLDEHAEEVVYRIAQDTETQQVLDLARYEKVRHLARRKGQEQAEQAEKQEQRWGSTRLSDIGDRPTYWLWRHRIPMGEISLVAGRGGIGKSLVLCTMTAWITTGTMKGEFYGHPRDVIFVANEDSYEKTVVPRMRVAGADLDRVHRVDIEMPDGANGRLVLPIDCARLGEIVKATDSVAVFLDPLSSNMMDKDRNSPEVRASYERLRLFADRFNVAVVGNAHTRKGGGADLLEAIMGSSEIGNVARAALGVMRDPDAETPTVILSQCKNNYGPGDLESYTYEIREEVYWDPHSQWSIAAPKIVWGDPTDRNVNDIFAEGVQTVSHSDVADCCEWLRSYLEMSPGAPRAQVIREAAKEGYKEHTIKRAAKRLKIVSRMSGYPRSSCWSLPEQRVPTEE
ncbi:AAA family ATPase [Streptomyces sp. NPDC101227]|uniref:AAA family ATPase n=1 Tax=Streptomyces sp. NPDC101227 TaxID=3366136 RepID=UPI0037FA0D30